MAKKSGRTEKNLEKLFAEESVSAARAEIFALRAKKEGRPNTAAFFKAVSMSRSVHARRFLRLLRGVVGPTEKNLKEIFENNAKKQFLTLCIKDAEQEGRQVAEHGLEQTLKVEKRITSLRTQTSENQKAGYHVCGVCGYIYIGEEPPENCPVCNAIKEKFKKCKV